MSDTVTRAVIQTEVGGNAGTELERLRKRAEDLKDALAEAWKTGDTAAQKKLDKALKETQRQIRTIQNDMVNVEQILKRLDKATPKELRQTLRSLEKDLKNIERGSKAWDEQTKKIKAVRTELAKIKAETQEHVSLWNRFAKKMFDWGAAIQTVMAAFTGITMTARKAVQAFAEIDQEMANVRKYTGMTKEQVESLNEEFKKMDTRSSREQLNQLAQEAGRLGMQSQEDVMGFVRAADKINVALDELGDGATLTLSKLTDIFGDRERLGVEKSLLSVGSVINELSQNCTASAPYIAEFASRLAGVGANAGMTTQQIMGIAAVMDSYGQKVESSATALSQVIVRLYRDPAKYAKVAGIDVKNFTDLLKKDANAALIQLLETLNKVGGMDVLSPMFADMGENGARAIQALSTMAKHIDEVKAQQEVANQAFEEAISIDKEFNVQNNTVQAGLEKAKKNFNEVAIALGEKLAPLMKYTITSSSALMKVIAATVDFLIKEKSSIIIVASSIAVYYIAVNTATIATKAYAAAQMTVTVACKAFVVVWKGLATVMYTCTLQADKARKAWIALNAVMKTNPYSMMIGAIVSAVAALALLAKRLGDNAKAAEEAARKQKEYYQSLKDVDASSKKFSENEISRLRALYAAVTNENLAREKRIEAVKQMQSIYPSVFSNFSTEEMMAGKAREAYEKLTDSIIMNARARAAAEKIMENEKEILELEQERSKLWKENKDAFDERKPLLERRRQAQESDDRRRPINQDVMVLDEGIHDLDKAIHRATQTIDKNKIRLNEIEEQIDDRKEANKWLQFHYDVTGVESTDSPTSTPQISYTHHETEKERKARLAEEKKRQAEEAKQARIAAALEKKEFKDAMDQAEANWTTKRTESLKEYREGLLDYEQYLKNLHQAADEYYETALAVHKKHGTEESDAAKKLNEAREKEQQDHEKRMLQIRLDRYADDRDAAKTAAQMAFYDPDNSEAYHNQRLLDKKRAKADIDYLEARLKEYEQGTKEYYEAEKALDKACKEWEVQRRKQLEEDLMTWSIAYQRQSAEKKMAIELAVIDELVRLDKMKTEEAEKVKAQIRKKYRDQQVSEVDSATGTKAPGADMDKLGEDRDRALEALESYKGTMSEEEYQSRRHQIIKNYHDKVIELVRSEGSEWATMLTTLVEKWKTAMDDLNPKNIADVAEAAFAIMNVGLQMYMEQAAAARDLEVAKAEKSYERQISMAEGNAYKTKQLEKKKQKEVAKIKNEYNKRAQTIEIAQAIASTAMAAINAYASASKVSWILGPIAAAMATAAGMMQIATIKKQHEAEAAGYSKGGFTPDGRPDEPVGVVHAGEWVASQKLLKNPQARAAIEALDYAQRNNTIGRLSAADVSRSVTAPQVIAGAAGDGSMQRTMTAMVVVMERYGDTMERLGQRLDEPFVTVNTVTGDTGIKQAQDEYQRLQNNTLPKSKRK